MESLPIKQMIKRWPIVKWLLKTIPRKNSIDFRSLSQQEKVNLLMNKYERLVGYRMDINNPQTYTEKIQWYKLFYEGNGNLIRVVDKYLFKGYIKEILGDGFTIPLYGAYKSLSEIEKGWSDLPNEFVLKSNLSCDGKFIKFIHDKSRIDIEILKNEIKPWFNEKNLLSYGFCRAYQDGKPMIIAEQYLENVKDQLYDYKFFCFDGKPFCCSVNTQHFEKGKERTYPITFYDLNWNRLNVRYGDHEAESCQCPKHLKEMLRLSRVLSKDFPQVRVDFFDTDDKLYVAELTLYPGGGYVKYYPESFNYEMGKHFKLPISEDK